MATDMIPPAHAPDFLAAHGWAGAAIEPKRERAAFHVQPQPFEQRVEIAGDGGGRRA